MDCQACDDVNLSNLKKSNERKTISIKKERKQHKLLNTLVGPDDNPEPPP